MDLEAAKLANGKSTRWTRFAMIAGFATVCGLLLVSLASAQSGKEFRDYGVLVHATATPNAS